MSVIQLIDVAKSADVKKYGAEIVVNNFITGVQKLYKDATLPVCGRENKSHGPLAFYMGDTRVAQAIGGFQGRGWRHEEASQDV